MAATGSLNKCNELGKGGYGSVYLAKDLRCEGTTAAVKILNKASILPFAMNCVMAL